jgi:hypothetical protein
VVLRAGRAFFVSLPSADSLFTLDVRHMSSQRLSESWLETRSTKSFRGKSPPPTVASSLSAKERSLLKRARRLQSVSVRRSRTSCAGSSIRQLCGTRPRPSVSPGKTRCRLGLRPASPCQEISHWQMTTGRRNRAADAHASYANCSTAFHPISFPALDDIMTPYTA